MNESLRKWTTRGLFAGAAVGFAGGGILNSKGLEVVRGALEQKGLPVTHENILKFLHENPDNLIHTGSDLLAVAPELFVAGVVLSAPGLATSIGELVGGIFSFGTRRQSVAASAIAFTAVIGGPRLVSALENAHEGVLSVLVSHFF